MEERVLSAVAATAVRCYLDPVSPYAWLAARDFGRLEAAGAAVVVVPVLFAGLLKAHGNLGPAEVPAKRRYLFRDVMREAARRGLPFAGPPGHPFNPLLALRMMTALEDGRERTRLALALAAACWEDGADIADPRAAQAIATAAGFDGALLLEAAATDAVKAGLAAATAQAVRDGVFGVPTFAIEGSAELFWGGDRMAALLWRLQGKDIDAGALEGFLARPPRAERRR